jgi:hypothetical protein
MQFISDIIDDLLVHKKHDFTEKSVTVRVFKFHNKYYLVEGFSLVLDYLKEDYWDSKIEVIHSSTEPEFLNYKRAFNIPHAKKDYAEAPKPLHSN